MPRVTIRLSEDEFDWLKTVAPANSVTTTTYFLISTLRSRFDGASYGQIVAEINNRRSGLSELLNTPQTEGQIQ